MFGQVLDVKLICHPEVRHGLEIQISSTSGDTTNVRVVIPRGPNRYVDELRYRDPQNSLGKVDHECISGNLRSRKLSVNWYDIKIAETEKQMDQLIGN